MTRSTLSTTTKRLAAITLIGLALMLQGCARLSFCGGHLLSDCAQLMPEAGIYRVTYRRDAGGSEQTVDTITSSGGLIGLCDCSEILSATLIVRNLSPDCSQASATIHTLWPPNQDFVNIPIAGVTDPEGSTVGIRIDRVEQDERDRTLFPGDLFPDTRSASPSTAEVRAERDPNGNGRVYRIHFTAEDDQDGRCEGEERVCVPLFEGGTCVDEDNSADPSLTGSDAPDPVTQGDLLTYTLNISNGPTDKRASNVTLTDTLPPGVTFVSAEIDGNSQRCTESLGIVTCSLGDMFGLQNKTARIMIRPATGGMITNSANVRALEKDPDLNNNTLTQTTTVNPAAVSADASVSIAAAPNPVRINNELKFTIVVQNLNAQTAASGVTMTGFTIQPIGELNGVDTTQGSCSTANGIITCNIGALAGGASATVTIKAFPFDVGTYTETVRVTSNNDPNAANNSASVEVQVKPP